MDQYSSEPGPINCACNGQIVAEELRGTQVTYNDMTRSTWGASASLSSDFGLPAVSGVRDFASSRRHIFIPPTATTNNMDWLASASSPLSSPTLTPFNFPSSPSISPVSPPSPAFSLSLPLSRGALPHSSHSSSNSYQPSHYSYGPSSLFGQTSSDSHLPRSVLGLSGRHSISPSLGWNPRDLHSTVCDYFTFL